MSVTEWVSHGGAELGTSRADLPASDLDALAAAVQRHRLDGLLMIGGWAGYRAAHRVLSAVDDHPALAVPIVCLPASINNDLPGSELSIGTDTALNSIVTDVDKIKQSAVASGRCFVVEVMGRDCGYLGLLGGLATGAERAYLPEEGITLDDLREDVAAMTAGFAAGKRLGLVIRGERADPIYTTDFLRALFEREGGDLFDVRTAILGHVQQGGDPSPFDRIQATRLAARCVDYLIEQSRRGEANGAMIGLTRGRIRFTDLADLPALVDPEADRPRHQGWLALQPVARIMAGAGAAAAGA